MTTVLAETLGAIRQKLRRATDDLTGEIAKMREGITARRRALRDIVYGHASLDEVRERIRRLVDETAREWLAKGNWRVLGAEDREKPHRGHGLAGFGRGRTNPPFSPHDPLPWGAICAAEPERACALLLTLVQATPGYVPGPPYDAASQAATKAEAELHELEAAEEKLVDEANESGLAIKHRDDVFQRRERERERAKEERRKVENREAREAELNRQHLERQRQPRTSTADPFPRDRPEL